MRFHHIGVATEDAATLSERFNTVLGVRERHAEVFAGMEIRFVDFGDGYLELLEPLGASPVAEHLADHGPGIHHVAFETPDIEGRLERAADTGVALLDETPRSGAWGLDIAFLDPSDTGGVLIEYVASVDGSVSST